MDSWLEGLFMLRTNDWTYLIHSSFEKNSFPAERGEKSEKWAKNEPLFRHIAESPLASLFQDGFLIQRSLSVRNKWLNVFHSLDFKKKFAFGREKRKSGKMARKSATFPTLPKSAPALPFQDGFLIKRSRRVRNEWLNVSHSLEFEKKFAFGREKRKSGN